MNEAQVEELLDAHKWLMRHCGLLQVRYDDLPRWALIRQRRILNEWFIALDLGERALEGLVDNE